MIYFYRRLENHNIEKLHKYLDYFYQAMFSETSRRFNKKKLIHPDCLGIVDDYKDQLLTKMKDIFVAYGRLTADEREIVRRAYKNNNDIAGICSGTCDPVKYEELPANIGVQVKNLYENLWQPILGYAGVVSHCGTVKQHFDDFMTQNSHRVCPFCGLEGLLCEYDDGRDDYDHYIPKGQYPFNCVNFANLIPMCHNCNSKNKGQVDPVFTDNDPPERRELFYPFDSNGTTQSITVKIDAPSIDLSGNDWHVEISYEPANLEKKVDAWTGIFNIKNRYEAPIRKGSHFLKEHVINKYKRWQQRSDFNFDAFKEDLLDEIFDIKERKNGIIDKAVYDFFFSQADFESWLRGQI